MTGTPPRSVQLDRLQRGTERLRPGPTNDGEREWYIDGARADGLGVAPLSFFDERDVKSCPLHPAATIRDWFTRGMTEPLPEPEPIIDPNEPVPDDPAELLPDAPEPLPPPPIEATPEDPGGDPGGVPEPA